MKRFVIDASIAVKWFVPEVHAIHALRLLARGVDLLAPEVLLAEAGDVLWKKCRLGELEAPEGEGILHALRRSALTVQPVGPLLGTAWEISVQYQRTFYDGLYLALAVTEGALLVTADDEFRNAMKQTPLARTVLWVEDVP